MQLRFSSTRSRTPVPGNWNIRRLVNDEIQNSFRNTPLLFEQLLTGFRFFNSLPVENQHTWNGFHGGNEQIVSESISFLDESKRGSDSEVEVVSDRLYAKRIIVRPRNAHFLNYYFYSHR